MKKYKIEWMSFLPPFIAMVVAITMGIFFTETLESGLNKVLNSISENFGWLFMLTGLFCLFCCAYLALSKTGNIRLGGKDAKPEFSLWQWFSICLCSGIGTGILFWAMAEPMFTYALPSQASGFLPFSREAGVSAISQTAFHWTIIQFSIYTMGALAIALIGYNKGQEFSINAALIVIIGEKKANGPIGKIIHSVCIFSICGGVAGSIGAALLQIGSGLNNATGIPVNVILWLIIAIFLTTVFTTSCIAGMKKGLQFISSLNAKIFIGMMIYIFIVGPTVFIADIGTTALGQYITKFFDYATVTNALTTDGWAKNWPVQYYGSFINIAPVIGLFYARLAKGRSLKQFIGMTVLGPSIFGFLWITVFGGSAIFLQSTGQADVWASIQNLGMQSTVFNIFNEFPLSKIFTIVFILAVSASLITYADPLTSTLAVLSCKSLTIDQEPPTILKLIWGSFIGTVGYLLIVTGGIDGVRGMFTLAGFLLIFLLIALCFAAIKIAHRIVRENEAIDDARAYINK